MDGLKIVLSEQVEGAEELVILDVERPCGLEVTLEGNESWGLYVELLGCPHLAELLVVVRSRDSGSPPGSAAMVVVRVSIKMWVMLSTVVEELRHDYRVLLELCWWRMEEGGPAGEAGDWRWRRE